MSVAFVIASFRYGHLVCHALESVLAQTRKPDQIIVLDDGVGDCGHVPEKYPEVEFIRRPVNLGTVTNFNQALFHEVKTDRVMFLGADNWLGEDALEKLEPFKEDIVSYDWRIVGELRAGFPSIPRPLHGSSLYDVAKARAVGGYASSGGVHSEEDSVLFGKMLAAGATTRHVDEALLYYRRHRHNGNFP